MSNSISSAGILTIPTGGGGASPNPVTNLRHTQQGGGAAALTNRNSFSWNGSSGATGYNVRRNGVLIGSPTTTSFTDTNAPNALDPTFAIPSITYSYTVTAFNLSGESALAFPTFWVYQNGVATQNQSSFSYGTGYTDNWAFNLNGRTCIQVNYPAVGGGYQPTVDVPLTPQWASDIGAYNFLTIDINPGPVVVPGDVLSNGQISRLPPGDVFGQVPAPLVFSGLYGPTPQPNVWATYKIPVVSAGIGKCNFVGSISGAVLTVNSITGPQIVDAGGFVLGPGVPSGTYITGYNQFSSIGTFPIAGPGINGSTNVPQATLQFQRTQLYKFSIFRGTQGQPATYYFDNVGFLTN